MKQNPEIPLTEIYHVYDIYKLFNLICAMF